MKTIKAKFYIGLDVHKRFTSYVVRDINGQEILNGSCASTPKDLHKILEPYLCLCVIGIETNTEIYPIYDFFKAKKIDIRVANMHKIRELVDKDDPLDAKRLADMLRLGTFPCSFIPEMKQRELRSLVKTRHAMLEECIRLKSQIQSLIRKHGLVMPPGESFTKKWCAALQSHMFCGKGGYDMRHLYDLHIFTNNKLENITAEMISFASKHFQKEFEAINAKEGVGPVLATYFISEICPITRFADQKKLRRYAGVIPCSEKSGGKVYATMLPKISSRGLLRWALIQASHCMSKFNEPIKEYYKKKKRQKKIAGKALMAVASSVSDILYNTLCQVQRS
jgi:transposase